MLVWLKRIFKVGRQLYIFIRRWNVINATQVTYQLYSSLKIPFLMLRPPAPQFLMALSSIVQIATRR